MERPPSLSHHKSIKWRGHPLPSMVIDNPWFCSMVWLQCTLYLFHPWYFTTHGFDPWHGSKAHCNNVIKRIYAFSIKNSNIFGILPFWSYYFVLIIVNYSWIIHLILCFERWSSLSLTFDLNHGYIDNNLKHYTPPVLASKPFGSHPPRSVLQDPSNKTRTRC